MSKSYVIQWKSTVNGRAGKGTKLFGIEEATLLAEELNSEFPEIHHEVVESGPGPVPQMHERAPMREQPEPVEQTEAPAEVSKVNHSPDFAFSA